MTNEAERTIGKVLLKVGEARATARTARGLLKQANSIDPLPQGALDLDQDLETVANILQGVTERIAGLLADEKNQRKAVAS